MPFSHLRFSRGRIFYKLTPDFSVLLYLQTQGKSSKPMWLLNLTKMKSKLGSSLCFYFFKLWSKDSPLTPGQTLPCIEKLESIKHSLEVGVSIRTSVKRHSWLTYWLLYPSTWSLLVIKVVFWTSPHPCFLHLFRTSAKIKDALLETSSEIPTSFRVFTYLPIIQHLCL